MRSFVSFALGLLLLSGAALAFTYRVDTSGGTPALEEEVAAAIAAWQGEDEAVLEAAMAEDASTVIAYGQAQRFGPDLYSLTLSQVGPDAQQVRVLVNPSLRERRQTVLLHEVGILAGLPEGDTGVMSPRLGPDSPATIMADERSALVGLQTAVPEDLNRDGVVDFYDLVAFARAYGRSGVNLAADLNRDGTVDREDLELLRAAYTFSAPSERPPAQAGQATPETLPTADGEDDGFLEDLLDDLDPEAPEEEELNDEDEGGGGTP